MNRIHQNIRHWLMREIEAAKQNYDVMPRAARAIYLVLHFAHPPQDSRCRRTLQSLSPGLLQLHHHRARSSQSHARTSAQCLLSIRHSHLRGRSRKDAQPENLWCLVSAIRTEIKWEGFGCYIDTLQGGLRRGGLTPVWVRACP